MSDYLAEWERNLNGSRLVTSEGEIVATVERNLSTGTWRYKAREFVSQRAAEDAVQRDHIARMMP